MASNDYGHRYICKKKYLSTSKRQFLTILSGVLVEAMRKGHWIILDELNLAPTDVLEALNRVCSHLLF